MPTPPPSNPPRRPDSTRRSPDSNPSDQPPASRRRKKTTKPRLALFYILTLITGVVVCLVLFALAFRTMQQNNPVIEGQLKTAPPIQLGLENKTVNQITGMITAIDSSASPKIITLLDIQTGRKNDYAVIDTTDIKNQYGSPMALSEFEAGQIVEIGFSATSRELSAIMVSSQAWEYKHINNVRIDVDASTVTIGNDSYTFTSQTLITYQGTTYPVGQIIPIDVVSLTGYKDKAWSIRLNNSHGFLRIENAEKVINGTLAVNTSIYMGLDEATEAIPLVEGTHRVIVEGQNITPFVNDVVIRHNETTYVNLIEVEARSALLRVTVNEPDCAIIVDGEMAEDTNLITLSYGDHTVRIEKDGYIPVQQNVTINKSYSEISITLVKVTVDVQITVYTSPSPVEVYIDNVFAGYSPLVTNVAQGSHIITARKSGYNDNTITKIVTENDNMYYLILTEAVSDPFGNLPALPDGTEPVVP